MLSKICQWLMIICSAAYQKHDIPSLDDEVWRLCWIAKDGKICKKLEENEIYKVKDFITQYHSNESLLRSVRFTHFLYLGVNDLQCLCALICVNCRLSKSHQRSGRKSFNMLLPAFQEMLMLAWIWIIRPKLTSLVVVPSTQLPFHARICSHYV